MAATQLVVTQAPTSYQSQVAFAPAIVVEARDGSNVKDTSFTGVVTLTPDKASTLFYTIGELIHTSQTVQGGSTASTLLVAPALSSPDVLPPDYDGQGYRCIIASVLGSAWSAATAYSVGDHALDPGNSARSYRCIQANTNHTVSDAAYWTLDAVQGESRVVSGNTGTGQLDIASPFSGAPSAGVTVTVRSGAVVPVVAARCVAGVATFTGFVPTGWWATNFTAASPGLTSASTGSIAATGTRAHRGVAELPRLQVDTTYPSTISATYLAGPGKTYPTLQAAINAAAAAVTTQNVEIIGDNVTFSEDIRLRARPAANTGQIIIRRPSHPAPSGTRVQPFTFFGSTSKITGTNREGQVQTEWVAGSPDQSAHHYRLVGFEVTSELGFIPNDDFALVFLGGSGAGNGDYTTMARLPHHIIIDRCYVHGNSSMETNKGIYCDAYHVAVIDSYVSEIHQLATNGADTNAFLAINTPGPILLQNTYLEGAGENIMIGGGDPAVTDAQFSPSDITITKCHIAKPPAWKGTWGVKNIVEIKNGHRVLLEGNVLEGNWDNNSQHGAAFVFKGTNQDNTAPWSSSEDITCRYNFVRRVGMFAALCGNVDFTVSAGTRRIEVYDNVGVGMNTTTFDGALACIEAALDSGADCYAYHNTVLAVPGDTKGLYCASATENSFARFSYDDNITQADDNPGGGGFSYGIFGDGFGGQNGPIDHYIVGGGGTFNKNILVGTRGYTGTNFSPTTTVVADEASVGFADPSVLTEANVAALTPDQILAGLIPVSGPAASAGSDRSYIGADIATLRSTIAGAWSAGELTGEPAGGTATHLALTTQPSGAVSGVALTQQPVVAVEDASNATVTDDTSTVTASWVGLSGDASASGTLAVAAVAGSAAWTTLALSWTVNSTGYFAFARAGLPTINGSVMTLTTAPTAGFTFASVEDDGAFAWAMTPTRVSRPVVLMTQHDTAPPLHQKLLGADGAVQQLPAGTTAVMTLYNPFGQLVVNRGACTIVDDGTDRAVEYAWQANDLALPGTYTAEIEITVPAPNAGVVTFPTPPVRIVIVVGPELG